MSTQWNCPVDFLDAINGDDAPAKIEKLIRRHDNETDRKTKKELSDQIRAAMSDYNEEVGFLAYNENQY
jgi:hypothetical protein